MNRLEGKVALVTGGSSGIGRVICEQFAAEGAAVVVADLAPVITPGERPTHRMLRERGAQAEFVRTDVADSADVDAAVELAVERYGSLDVLVNNAATYVDKPLLDTSEAEWNLVLAVNLTGVFLASKRAVRQMLTQDMRDGVRGRIVNISSQHGMIAAPEDIAYGTSKSGVVYITRQIATDYATQGIICNAVAPGKILTGAPGREGDPYWTNYWTSRTPLPRLGTPDDVARAAVYLASDDATYITGINLMVDGGWSAS